MDAMDFSRYSLSGKYYGGSEKKLGIIIDKKEYMVKFQKRTAFGKRNNHVSEYLGSHIFSLLGFEAQDTMLGYYKGEEVVVCKDFNIQGKQFVPFNDVGESTLDHDKETYQYDYEDIMQMLRDNSKLTNVDDTIAMFWRIYVVDALLGNFDRHGANWGFIKENDRYSLAPVFDNGSCLFPNLIEEAEMRKIMNSVEETNKRIYTFPTSQIRLHGKKISYYDVIHSREFEECNQALQFINSKVNLSDINILIENTPLVSENQKDFYKYIICERYQKILEEKDISQ